jgi:hypothetical protein
MTSNRRLALAVFAVGTLLAGCALTPPAEPPAPPPPPPEAAETRPYPPPAEPRPPIAITVEPAGPVRALTYFNRARQRPARELRSEYDSLRRTFAASQAEHDRVRLALLLSLPHTGFHDDAQALELLEPLARDTGSEYHALAQLVTSLLVEQRRAVRHAAALQQKLDRIRALEKEMQQRAATPESKKR